MASTFIKQCKLAAFKLRTRLIRWQCKLRGSRVFVFYLDPALARKCEALTELLNQHGFRAEIAASLSRRTRLLLRGTTDLWIGLWNSVPLELLPEHFVFWNGEPTGHHDWDDAQDWSPLDQTQPLRWHESAQHRRDWKQAMHRSQAVWGYTRASEHFTQGSGKPFTFVPFGYSPYYERVFNEVTGGQPPVQDIDVLFFGWTTERRKRILEELQRRGVNLRVVDEHHPVVGAALEQLMARSKIVLGIYGYDQKNTHVPDFARFDFLFANRIFALHERPSDAGRDADFEAHVPVSEYDQLVESCLHYLRHPDQRAQAAERTYQWFKTTYPLEAFIPFDSLRALNGPKPMSPA